MKKIIKDNQNKSPEELNKQINNLELEIKKLSLSLKINPPKDVNLIMKKRKALAVFKTLLNQRKQAAVNN